MTGATNQTRCSQTPVSRFLRNSIRIAQPDVSSLYTSLSSTKAPGLRFSHLIGWLNGPEQLAFSSSNISVISARVQIVLSAPDESSVYWNCFVDEYLSIKDAFSMKWVVGGMIALDNDGRSWTLHIQVVCATQGHVADVVRSTTQLLQKALYKCHKQLAFTECHGFDLMTLWVFFFSFHFLGTCSSLLSACWNSALARAKALYIGKQTTRLKRGITCKASSYCTCTSCIWNLKYQTWFRECIMEHFVELF